MNQRFTYFKEEELDIDYYALDKSILKFMYSFKDYYKTKFWKQKQDFPNEVWADFTDYEGLYQISNYGRVKSVSKGTIKQAELHDNMNLSVHLQRNRKSNYRSIPLEVARHFNINPNGYKYITYKDGNVLHCHCTNLKWVEKRPLTNEKKGFKIRQYTLDGKLVKEYKSIREVCRVNGYNCRQGLAKAARGEYKQMYGYIWKYKEEH